MWWLGGGENHSSQWVLGLSFLKFSGTYKLAALFPSHIILFTIQTLNLPLGMEQYTSALQQHGWFFLFSFRN